MVAFIQVNSLNNERALINRDHYFSADNINFVFSTIGCLAKTVFERLESVLTQNPLKAANKMRKQKFLPDNYSSRHPTALLFEGAQRLKFDTVAEYTSSLTKSGKSSNGKQN